MGRGEKGNQDDRFHVERFLLVAGTQQAFFEVDFYS